MNTPGRVDNTHLISFTDLKPSCIVRMQLEGGTVLFPGQQQAVRRPGSRIPKGWQPSQNQYDREFLIRFRAIFFLRA